MSEAEFPHSKPLKVPWRTMYFRLEAPEAEHVSVVGTFNDWNPAQHQLCKNANGVWECQMPLPAGQYAYCFVVDGVWQPDPQRAQRMHTTAGLPHCLLDVPSPPEEAR